MGGRVYIADSERCMSFYADGYQYCIITLYTASSYDRAVKFINPTIVRDEELIINSAGLLIVMPVYLAVADDLSTFSLVI